MGNLAAQLLFAVQAIKQHGVPSYLLVCTYVCTKQVYFNHEALKTISHLNGRSSGIFYAEHHKSFLKKRNYSEFFILNLLHTKNKDSEKISILKNETIFPNPN